MKKDAIFTKIQFLPELILHERKYMYVALGIRAFDNNNNIKTSWTFFEMDRRTEHFPK